MTAALPLPGPAVLGIDVSLTSTGVARISSYADPANPPKVTTHCVETTPPKRAKGDKTPATLTERRSRLLTVRSLDLGMLDRQYALAVVEAPSYSSIGGAAWDRAGAWWMVLDRLLHHQVPVAIVPPATRALWATGSGKASKTLVGVHMSRMWPQVDPDGLTDDEWDSLALASMGAQQLGLIPVELERHRQQLAKITWPDTISPLGATA